MVGEEDDRSAVGRYLHGTQHHALTGELAGNGPLQ